MSDVPSALQRVAPSERTFLGHLFGLSRPRFWLYLAGPVVVGLVYAADSIDELFHPLAVALFLYFLIPANVFLYGVNDIFDVDVDEYNPKKSDEGREVRYTGGWKVPATVVASAVIGLTFVPILPAEAVAGMAGFLVLGTAYSAPPARLKTTPVLDSFSNGLYVMPAIVAYSTLADGFPPLLAIAGGWAWAMAMHTFSAIPDIEPDRDARIETTATLLGERWTLFYCAGGWLLATALMGAVHPFLGAVFLVYPVFVGFVTFLTIDVDRAYWWFPALNTLAGMVLTMGGIWRVLYG